MAIPVRLHRDPPTTRPGRDGSSRVAVALTYKPERSAAPQVVAKGKGPVADRILAAAEEHEVPIVRNVGLAGALMSLRLGREIPPRVYHLVAEVLAFVYSIGEKADD